jgi:hypothetical protein
MEPELIPNRPADDPALFIHLDLNGVAALLAAIQEAMESGRAQLPLGASGITARGDAVGLFPAVTITFQQPRDSGREDIPVRAAPAVHRLLELAE